MLSLEGEIKSYSHFKLLRASERIFFKKNWDSFLSSAWIFIESSRVSCGWIFFCRFYDSLGSRMNVNIKLPKVLNCIWNYFWSSKKIINGSCSMNFVEAPQLSSERVALFIPRIYKYMQIWCVIKMIILRFEEEPRDKLRIRFLSQLLWWCCLWEKWWSVTHHLSIGEGAFVILAK